MFAGGAGVGRRGRTGRGGARWAKAGRERGGGRDEDAGGPFQNRNKEIPKEQKRWPRNMSASQQDGKGTELA